MKNVLFFKNEKKLKTNSARQTLKFLRLLVFIFSQHRSRATLFAYYRELIPETLHLSIFTFTVKI